MKPTFFRILIAFICLALLVGRYWWPTGTALGLLNIPLLLWGLWQIWKHRKAARNWLSWGVISLTVLLGVNLVGEQLWRLRFPASIDKPQEVSILTYNLFFRNLYPEVVLREIQNNPADILLVQEFTPEWKARLAKVTGHYPYQRHFERKGAQGFGLYSKYPIRKSYRLRGDKKRFVSQISTLSINGKEVVLVNGHLRSPALAVENPDNFISLWDHVYKARKIELEALEKDLAPYSPETPMILAGDLNTMRIEPIYRDLRHTWGDVFVRKGKGPGQTFPNVASIPYPVMRLDYILYRGPVKPLEARVLQKGSSDHLAVWGKVGI
ncbi:MAG: endonuclease/exonuclease/phosphatase family protein [Bacteroidota bacterium]